MVAAPYVQCGIGIIQAQISSDSGLPVSDTVASDFLSNMGLLNFEKDIVILYC